MTFLSNFFMRPIFIPWILSPFKSKSITYHIRSWFPFIPRYVSFLEWFYWNMALFPNIDWNFTFIGFPKFSFSFISMMFAFHPRRSAFVYLISFLKSHYY